MREALTERQVNRLPMGTKVRIHLLNNPSEEYKLVEISGDTFSSQYYFQSTCEEVFSLKIDDSDFQNKDLALQIYLV